MLLKRTFVAVLCLTSLWSDSRAQDLQHRPETPAPCPAVQIRFTAKYADGTAVSELQPNDVKVTFRNGPSEIVALRNFAQQKDATGITALLVIVPPHADVIDNDVKQLVTSLVRSELRFQAAVLGPDGKLSAYSSEPAVLQAELMSTIARQKKAMSDEKTWVLTEESGFLNLWRLPGRHTILRLMIPENRSHNTQKGFYLYDTTVDHFAIPDQTAVYRLTPPFQVALAIPSGDASTPHEMQVFPSEMLRIITDSRSASTILPSTPNEGTLQQQLRSQAATASQGQLWADKASWNRFTGGRAEDSIPALIQDLASDNKASYSLIVHPQFACPGASFYDVQVSARDPQVHLFAPTQIQMRPYVEVAK